jgi:hypothetical protein
MIELGGRGGFRIALRGGVELYDESSLRFGRPVSDHNISREDEEEIY